MTVLHSQIDPTSAAFRRNAEAYEAKRRPLAEARAAALAGGGEKAQARHRGRGKLTARQRVNRLLDPGTPFMEIGQLAGHEVYDEPLPSADISAMLRKIRPRWYSSGNSCSWSGR
jgi:3-methylcrotonyl-CoA carboxylase beta subunit